MVKLVNKHRKENGDVDRITMVEYKWKDKDLNKKFHSNGNEYNYKLEGVAMIDDKSLPDLLIYLSTLEKIIYQWKGKTFTTFEVNLFINIFKKKDEKGVEGVEGKGEVEGKGKSEGGGEGQDKGVDYGEPDGLLTHAELVSLIDDDSFLEPKHEEETKNEFNDGDSINALFFLDEGKREGKAESEGRGKGEGEGEGEGEGNGQGEGQAESQGKVQDKGVDKDGDSINALMFLATILKHKPNGKGLDMVQLRKCSDLYTSFYVNLPTDSVVDLFLSLQIVSNDYVGLLYEIEHVQPPLMSCKSY
ncbi:uncharacterized protein LOC126837670 [Adelges cooleyi]|uniref:uncharacterized protein LOC126837670 n=1 Tax=Adelges cooleyi TaxID=133065 RepID=UPI00218053DB|nr:uncharacterized protein LOC126837670 [Adelges cooleyi]